MTLYKSIAKTWTKNKEGFCGCEKLLHYNDDLELSVSVPKSSMTLKLGMKCEKFPDKFVNSHDPSTNLLNDINEIFFYIDFFTVYLMLKNILWQGITT